MVIFFNSMTLKQVRPSEQKLQRITIQLAPISSVLIRRLNNQNQVILSVHRMEIIFLLLREIMDPN